MSVVGGFVLGKGNAADGGEQPFGVESIHVFGGGRFNVSEVLPRPSLVDQNISHTARKGPLLRNRVRDRNPPQHPEPPPGTSATCSLTKLKTTRDFDGSLTLRG